MLLPEEGAGVISTRTAGAVDFAATLAWRTPEESFAGKILASLPDSAGVKLCLTEMNERDSATRRISGEILALQEPELTLALDALLRAVSDAAALTGAVLETRAVRRATPREVSGKIRERLARDLRRTGFPVRFEPVWVPATGVDLALGTRGARKEIESFLAHHPRWEGIRSGP